MVVMDNPLKTQITEPLDDTDAASYQVKPEYRVAHGEVDVAFPWMLGALKPAQCKRQCKIEVLSGNIIM